MTAIKVRIRSVLTFCLAIAFLVNQFCRFDFINNFDIVLMMIIIILCFTEVSGSSKIIGIVLFTLSILLLLLYKAPLSVWKLALQQNLYLIVLFTMVPLLNIPIQSGGYFEALQGIFRRYVYTNRRFSFVVSLFSASIGSLVNLAVVPLVYQISLASDFSRNTKLLTSSINRGFTTVLMWAPTAGNVALILQLSGASWSNFFPYAIVCGFISGLVGYLITIYEEKPLPGLSEPPLSEINFRKIIELSAFGAILIVAIAIISMLTGILTIIAVSLASLIYPILWMGIIRRLPVFLQEFKQSYFGNSLPRLKNEIILFVGAGLFATSINYSHLGDYIPRVLSIIVNQNAILLAVIVMAVCLLLSCLGVHPIITMTIIGGTVKAEAFGVTPTFIALILAVSWSLGIIISPSSATVIAISALSGTSPILVGPRWNAFYVIAVSIVIVFVLALFRMAGFI